MSEGKGPSTGTVSCHIMSFEERTAFLDSGPGTVTIL